MWMRLVSLRRAAGVPSVLVPAEQRRASSWVARIVIVAVVSGLVSAGFTGLAASADAVGVSYSTSPAACAGVDPWTFIGACVTKLRLSFVSGSVQVITEKGIVITVITR